jgi:hypothetical protein
MRKRYLLAHADLPRERIDGRIGQRPAAIRPASAG